MGSYLRGHDVVSTFLGHQLEPEALHINKGINKHWAVVVNSGVAFFVGAFHLSSKPYILKVPVLK